MKNNVKKWMTLMLALLMMAMCALAVSADEHEQEVTDMGAVGDCLRLDLQVEADATGQILYYNEAFTIPASFELQSGDILAYDVLLMTEAGGIGSVDMYVGEGNNGAGDATLRDDVLCVDQEFLRAHPTVNIAGLAYNMWWSRQIYITDTFVAAAAGKDAKVLIAVDLPNASILAGQVVTVLYDNIRIIRNDETVYTIFADRSHVLPEEPVYYLNLNGNNAKVEGRLYIEENTYTPPQPTEPLPVETEPTQPKETKPAETLPKDDPDDSQEPDHTAVIVGIVAAVVVVAVVVVIVVVRKKKTH